MLKYLYFVPLMLTTYGVLMFIDTVHTKTVDNMPHLVVCLPVSGSSCPIVSSFM